MLDAEKLKQLKDDGHITEEEYIDEKKRLAAQLLKREDPAHAKNGIIYILLGWFLGTLGLHNFYAGYWGRALVQLTLTVIAPWFLYIPLLITAAWAFGDILFVNKGALHIPFAGSRKFILLLRILAVIVFGIVLARSTLITEEVDFTMPETVEAPAELTETK